MFERVKAAITAFRGYDRSTPLGVTAGSIGFTAGGPLFLDAFHSKRPPIPYELVNAYKAIAYSCIRLNMNGVSRTPLKLYARTGRRQERPRRSCRRVVSDRVQSYIRSQSYITRTLSQDDAIDEITEHPFLEAFDNPNPYFDGEILLQHMVASMDVVGTCYLFPTRPLRPDGTPNLTEARAGMEIWPFQSQYVYPYKGMGDQLLKEYRYFGDTYHPDALIRIRYISLRDPYLSAYSPLHACFEQAGLSDYYTAVVESILKSGARPSLMVAPKDANIPLGEAERKRVEYDLNNRFTGGRSGHIWVTNGAIDVKPISFPPADLAGLNITQFMRLEIANCFDVPISLLQSEDSNRAVASEATHQHQSYAVAPRCRLIAAALTKQLARPVDDRLFFCFDDPVSRDVERDAKVWGMKLADGRATANEAREDEGLEPVEWGDEPWLPQTLQQPSQQAEKHEIGLQQQKDGFEQQKQAHESSLANQDQARKHAEERLGMEKSAAEKDAEDRAREAEDKSRSFLREDREIEDDRRLTESILDAMERSRVAFLNGLKIREMAEIEKERIRAKATVESRIEEARQRKLEAEWKAESEDDKLGHLANLLTVRDVNNGREQRTLDHVDEVLELIKGDLNARVK